ncbi:hypothetical protein [Bradyrhizobium ottawaense]|uniref:hypothetical protein n=1 Tax=Bradyrhizobium ottawaense TaxID=931866 RepID=UPI003FA0893F
MVVDFVRNQQPDQNHLPLAGVEIAQGVLDAAQEKAAAIIRGRSRGGSDQDRRVIEPAITFCPCACGAMTRIGEDISKTPRRDPST